MKKKTIITALQLIFGCTILKAQYTNSEVSRNLLSQFTSGLISTQLTSNTTLNNFFAIKTSTYLSEASDLSLSSAYAVLDNTDNKLFLGGTSYLGKHISNSRLLVTGGLKANIEDGFSSIIKSGAINKDIGFDLKLTIFGRGTIYFDQAQTAQYSIISNHRTYLANELLNEFDNKLTTFKRNQVGIPATATTIAISNYVQESAADLNEQFADRESAFIDEERLYNLSHTWWISINVYFPVTSSEYKTIPNYSSKTIFDKKYKPYEADIIWTNFWEQTKWTKNILLFKGVNLFSLKLAVLADNTINASLIDKSAIDTYINQNENPDTLKLDTLQLIQLNNQSVNVGEYHQFVTTKISARYVYMPVKFIGVSLAIEKCFGQVEALNWKIGIPISLKDSDGKANINFELHWREINKGHSVGVSIGLPIGKTIF
ncbi:MAG TPA: hypothetical protein PLN13_03310 [Bacteroidia bacterium]|nr:hypothetical protein [Bacteroidia bacterium]HRH07582.1 hypothetical protein [Bacteroidia bacterium]